MNKTSDTRSFILPALFSSVWPMLDSKSLDAASSGKAWNVMGLAYEDAFRAQCAGCTISAAALQ